MNNIYLKFSRDNSVCVTIFTSYNIVKQMLPDCILQLYHKQSIVTDNKAKLSIINVNNKIVTEGKRHYL